MHDGLKAAGLLILSNLFMTAAWYGHLRFARAPLAVAVLQRVASRMLLVSERAIARAVGAFADAGIRVEGAAAAGLAALDQLEDVEGPVVVVVTGRNIDDELWRRACEAPESFPEA